MKPSPICCEHANEQPQVCMCPPDCYCRTEGSCRNRTETDAYFCTVTFELVAIPNTSSPSSLASPGMGRRYNPATQTYSCIPYTADELFKFLREIKPTVDQATSLKMENRRLHQQNEGLRQMVNSLRAQVEHYQDQPVPTTASMDDSQRQALLREIENLKATIRSMGGSPPAGGNRRPITP